MTRKKKKKRLSSDLRRRNNAGREQSGECWYCGIHCRLGSESGKVIPDLATLEHTISRRNSLSRMAARSVLPDEPPVQGWRVMACWQCNQDRSRWTSLLNREASAEGAYR